MNNIKRIQTQRKRLIKAEELYDRASAFEAADCFNDATLVKLERFFRDNVYAAQRGLFRAENRLHSSKKIDPALFEKRFPASKALVKVCPLEKSKSVPFDKDGADARTHIVLPDHIVGVDDRFDWLHNNVATRWTVSLGLKLGVLGQRKNVSVFTFECVDDAFLFRFKWDGESVSGRAFEQANPSDELVADLPAETCFIEAYIDPAG